MEGGKGITSLAQLAWPEHGQSGPLLLEGALTVTGTESQLEVGLVFMKMMGPRGRRQVLEAYALAEFFCYLLKGDLIL